MKNTLTQIRDKKKQGGDSNVFLDENLQQCYKEYDPQHISKDKLEKYHLLQNFLSQYTVEIKGNGETKVDNILLEKCIVHFLPLDPKGVYPGHNVSTKEAVLTTNPRYINEKGLDELKRQFGDHDTEYEKAKRRNIDYLCFTINDFIKEKVEIFHLQEFGAKVENIKARMNGNVLHLTITDIAGDIAGLMNRYTIMQIEKLVTENQKKILNTINA